MEATLVQSTSKLDGYLTAYQSLRWIFTKARGGGETLRILPIHTYICLHVESSFMCRQHHMPHMGP